MPDWNVVITVRERGFILACELFEEFGSVSRTEFFNVLAMKTHDTHRLMEMLREQMTENPSLQSFLARVIPVTDRFSFQTPEEFRAKVTEIVTLYAPRLAGKGFYVRMHRRGFKGRLSSMEEESYLDRFLVEALEKTGSSAHVTFDNPDAIVAVETIAQDAGLSLWSREELERYPFLRLD